MILSCVPFINHDVNFDHKQLTSWALRGMNKSWGLKLRREHGIHDVSGRTGSRILVLYKRFCKDRRSGRGKKYKINGPELLKHGFLYHHNDQYFLAQKS